MVRVPVLSVLIALVAPSVSTSVRFLTTALACGELLGAVRQQAGHERRHAGRDGRDGHRGAEQQHLIERHAASEPTTTMNGDRRPGDDAEHLRQRVELALQRRPGALHRVSIDAIRPIWVCMPVAVTTIVAVPRVTEVFWNTMLVRSPSATSPAGERLGVLGRWARSPRSAPPPASPGWRTG